MSVQLNFEVYGVGKPVIILHGLFGSARNWRSMAKSLANSYTVFTIDLRNHGESAHANSMYYIEMMEDLKQFVQDQGIDKFSLLGHSLGGKVAMTFALTYQEMLDKVIILDIAPVRYQNNFRQLIDAMLALDLSRIKSRHEANDFLKPEIEEPDMRLFLLQNLYRDSNGFQWRINLSAISLSLADIGAFPTFMKSTQYLDPVLFLDGDKSDYILPEYHKDIYAFFPTAKISTINNANHWLHADQPERVLEEIVQFLDA